MHFLNAARHFITRALLSAPNFEQAQKVLYDTGVGAADGCSINMTFLKWVQFECKDFRSRSNPFWQNILNWDFLEDFMRNSNKFSFLAKKEAVYFIISKWDQLNQTKINPNWTYWLQSKAKTLFMRISKLKRWNSKYFLETNFTLCFQILTSAHQRSGWPYYWFQCWTSRSILSSRCSENKSGCNKYVGWSEWKKSYSISRKWWWWIH